MASASGWCWSLQSCHSNMNKDTQARVHWAPPPRHPSPHSTSRFSLLSILASVWCLIIRPPLPSHPRSTDETISLPTNNFTITYNILSVQKLPINQTFLHKHIWTQEAGPVLTHAWATPFLYWDITDLRDQQESGTSQAPKAGSRHTLWWPDLVKIRCKQGASLRRKGPRCHAAVQ